MSRKVISILLAIAMVLTMSPVIAFADDGIFDVSLDVTYGQTEASDVLLGDVDMDGYTTSSDARLILRASAKLEELVGAYALAADVYCDSVINAADARRALRISTCLDENPDAAPARTGLDVERSEDVSIEMSYDESYDGILTVYVNAADVNGLENGNLFFEYDPEYLSFESISSVYSDFDMHTGGCYEEGKISFSFLFMERCESYDLSIAAITFNVLQPEDTTIKCSVGTWEGTEVPYDTSLSIHMHDYDSVITAPTCTEEGYTTYVCSDCGDTYTDDYVDTLGHMDEDLDCICDICGDVCQYVINADETINVDIVFDEICIVAFVPETTGIYTFSSNSDSDTYGYLYDADMNLLASNDDSDGINFSITALFTAGETYYFGCRFYGWDSGSFDVTLGSHNCEITVIDPTCTKQGCTTYVCSDCEYEYISDYVEATGHVDDNLDEFCDICGESVTTHFEFEVSDAWVGEEVTLTLSAANMVGLESADLQFSFDSEHLEYVSVGSTSDSHFSLSTGGNPEDGMVTFSFYWLDSAKADSGLCQLTFKVLQAGTTTVSVTCNSWDGTETTPDDLSVDITPNSHDYIATVTEPTCTEEGYTTYVCSDCGYEYISDYVEATGHVDDNLDEFCDICGESVTTHFEFEVSDAWVGEEVTLTLSAANMVGLTSADLMFSFDPEHLEYVSVNGVPDANFDLWVGGIPIDSYDNVAFSFIYLDSTEAYSGLCQLTFKVLQAGTTTVSVTCNSWEGTETTPDDLSVDITPNFHDYIATVTEPTCTEEGYTTYVCSDCGYEYISDYVEATGHVDDNLDEFCDICGESVTTHFEFEVSDAWVGEEVTLTLSAANMAGLESADLQFSFDPEHLEYVDVYGVSDANFALWDGGNPWDGLVTFSFFYLDSAEADSGLCQLTFKVLQAGTTTVSVTCRSWDGTETTPDDLSVDITPNSHDYIATVTEPTCTEEGYTTYVCSDCEYTYVDDYVDPIGHKTNDDGEVTAPTCTEQGYTSYNCSVCGETYTDDYFDATGHISEGEGIITEATCTEFGYTTYVCSVCGESYDTDYVFATGHIDADFNDYCDICSEYIDKSTHFEFTVSDAYVGEEVVITLSAVNMVGLESADLVFTYDPTCLEYVNRSSLDANVDLWDGGIPIGSYGNVTFSFCYLDSAEADSGLCQLTFKVLQAGTTTVSVTCRSWDGSTPNVPEDASVIISCVEFEESCIEHSYGDEEIITAPTCTESGLSKKICTVCEAEETTVLEALGHDFSQEWTVDTPATCTAVGSQSHHCTRCDEITDVTEIAVAEHVTEHSIVASTCTTEGVEYDICCSCFEMFNYTVLPLAEHSYGEWTTTTEATCTEKGLSKGICTTCNAEETTEIEAKGHSYGEWTTTTEATCTEKGLSKRICTACNAEETTEIAAKGHSYVAVITDPACTQKGYTTYTCSVCSDSYAADYTEATGHSYGDWAVTKAPTFMYAGQESRSCTACTETEIREIEKLVPVTAYINADTGISVSVTDGSYEGDIIVDVNNVYDGSSYQVINAQVGNFAATVFDISTTVNGEKVQPNGTVLIKMPIPEGYSTDALVIYYLPNDGSAPEKMDSYIDGIYICFETTHFSEYAIVDESEELPVYVLGDVNNDGNINASDARTALRISAKLEEADEIQTLAADVNKDGTITAADARTILRVSAKLETF